MGSALQDSFRVPGQSLPHSSSPDWASCQEAAELWQTGELGGCVVLAVQVHDALHSLVETIADVKVGVKAGALRREISDKELGIVVLQTGAFRFYTAQVLD